MRSNIEYCNDCNSELEAGQIGLCDWEGETAKATHGKKN
jgi:hypothetical protein